MESVAFCNESQCKKTSKEPKKKQNKIENGNELKKNSVCVCVMRGAP